MARNNGTGVPHVALIVDNPLRDLEGLVLVAWQLAAKGARATLVPMYDQGFDVPALAPDLVLVNYTRPNNSDLIKTYKAGGILVGVLDTEGIGGKSPEHFAEMVAGAGCGDMIDLYCVWGQSQYDAFLRRGTVPKARLVATGCPRYDFCAEPWRGALALPAKKPGYILINTNFPTVNPRFSTGTGHEIEAMVKAGFAEDFAHRFIADARLAHETVSAVSTRLARALPDVPFVLRPHPFESIEAYAELASLPNVEVRQEGTSLEWIAASRLLLHQNCSTAIEATMLGVEPIAMEWFNTPALRLDAATKVSRLADSEATLVQMVANILEVRVPSLPEPQQAFRRDILRDLYLAIDGRAAERVAEAALSTICRARTGKAPPAVAPPPSLRGMAAHALRSALGHRMSGTLRRTFANADVERRREGKVFTLDDVNRVLERIGRVAPQGARWRALGAEPAAGRARRLHSRASLELREAA